MKLSSYILLLALLLNILNFNQCQIQKNITQLLWPLPKQFNFSSINDNSSVLNLNPQDLKINIISQEQQQNDINQTNNNSQINIGLIYETFEEYKIFISQNQYQNQEKSTSQNFTNNNQSSQQQSVIINLIIENLNLEKINKDLSENYEIMINQDCINVTVQNYVGYLRAIETLSQLIQYNMNQNIFQITNLPIYISDYPTYSYRGILIDSASHFIYKPEILRTLDAMMYNKMNVLHIVINNGGSFVLESKSYPDLSKTAYKPGQIYSIQDMQEIIQYGFKRGIRIIPMFNSPTHTACFSQVEVLQNITVCPFQYPWTQFSPEPPAGQLDPTMEYTYEVVSNIIKDLQEIFVDDYIHLAGDELSENCYSLKPSIQEWMSNNSISSYVELETYYRIRQKQFLNDNQQGMYWTQSIFNKNNFSDNDVLQYWGYQNQSQNIEELQQQSNVTSEVILSPYNYLYFDCGFGDEMGANSWCGEYKTWYNILQFDPEMSGFQNNNVIGAEACLWTELVKTTSVDSRLWMKASALSERLWNNEYYQGNSLINNIQQIVKRLLSMESRMQARGIQTEAVSSSYCSEHVDQCFILNDETYLLLQA